MIEVQNIEKIGKGSLVAKCEVVIVPWQMILKEIKIFQKGNNRWITMPNRDYIDKDGNTKYLELIDFISPQKKAKFKEQVEEAVKNYLKENPTMESKPVINMEEEFPF